MNLVSKIRREHSRSKAVPLPAWVTQAADPADAEALRKAITEAQGRQPRASRRPAPVAWCDVVELRAERRRRDD